jgi:hypothetical protein
MHSFKIKQLCAPILLFTLLGFSVRLLLLQTDLGLRGKQTSVFQEFIGNALEEQQHWVQ